MSEQGLLPNGFYSIENKQYGNINRGDINRIPPNIPVVAALQGGIWQLTCVRGDVYKIELANLPRAIPGAFLPTRAENNLLYVSEIGPTDDEWHIVPVGEYFVIFKIPIGGWALDSNETQVQVIPLIIGGEEVADYSRIIQASVPDFNECALWIIRPKLEGGDA